MNIATKELQPGKLLLTISGDETDLKKIKRHVLELLAKDVSAPGFRPGKAPLGVVEKQLGDNRLQSEVLEEAVNHLYSEGIIKEDLRVISQPKIQITKFAPFNEVEFTAEVEVVPPIKLADYKQIKAKTETPSVTAKDVDDVVMNLRERAATKKAVTRAAKTGDEVVIDFAGKDESGKAVAGGSGKDYELKLGSGTFIPGFEDELVGVKAGDDKSFTLTFPKDYAHRPLAGAKVTFAVKVKTVNELVLPKLDDEFAKTLGPIQDVAALKSDIKNQLMSQRLQEIDNKRKDKIVEQLVAKSDIPVPGVLLDDQIQHIKQDFIQNLTYRGMTLKEYLEQLGQSEEEWEKTELKPQAERRVKVGLALSEVARQEGLDVSDDELELRINLLKGQLQNPNMQAEYDKPEQRRDVASRLLTEKTVDRLVQYADKA